MVGSDDSGLSQVYHDGGEPEPVDEPGVAATESAYGDGAYVGSEPPEGYTIKGNEHSMKYHLAGSGGYEDTIAEVWFASEDTAQAGLHQGPAIAPTRNRQWRRSPSGAPPFCVRESSGCRNERLPVPLKCDGPSVGAEDGLPTAHRLQRVA